MLCLNQTHVFGKTLCGLHAACLFGKRHRLRKKCKVTDNMHERAMTYPVSEYASHYAVIKIGAKPAS